jgi:hypothetical protein
MGREDLNKKNEENLCLTGIIVFAIYNVIFIYLGLGVLWKFLFFLASYGILGLYFYNKDVKEEKRKQVG